MSKEDIKSKYGEEGKIKPISAQEYALLTDTEKDDLDLALADYSQDTTEYHKQRESLYPKAVTLKEVTWKVR